MINFSCVCLCCVRVQESMAFTTIGASMAWPSPTLIIMAQNETPFKLDVSQISWMVFLMFLGQIVIPMPSGYLMERLGHKKACLWLATIPFDLGY